MITSRKSTTPYSTWLFALVLQAGVVVASAEEVRDKVPVPASTTILKDMLVPNYGKFTAPPGLPFTRAVKVIVTAPSDPPWKITSQTMLKPAVASGDILVIRAWARNLSGDGTFAFVIQGQQKPWESVLGKQVRLTDKWQRVVVTGTVPRDWPENSIKLKVDHGFAKQTFALGPIRIENFGKTAPTPEQIEAVMP